MKTFEKTLLIFLGVALANIGLAQVSPETLGTFDKIVLDHKVKKVTIIKRSKPFLEVTNAGEEDVMVTTIGGILTLKAINGNDLELVVGNTLLRRVEGRKGLMIEGADYLKGGEGKFLLLGFHGGKSREALEGKIAVELEEEVEIELDIEMDYEMQ